MSEYGKSPREIVNGIVEPEEKECLKSLQDTQIKNLLDVVGEIRKNGKEEGINAYVKVLDGVINVVVKDTENDVETEISVRFKYDKFYAESIQFTGAFKRAQIEEFLVYPYENLSEVFVPYMEVLCGKEKKEKYDLRNIEKYQFGRGTSPDNNYLQDPYLGQKAFYKKIISTLGTEVKKQLNNRNLESTIPESFRDYTP